MRRIFFIAKNELQTLFYSPIAWILMILFLILTSADYIGSTADYLGMFERGGPALVGLENLTSQIMTGSRGYLIGVISNLYIFFPLITMGLISRETSSGTIRLLYSSPLRIREVVLGKYLAIGCFTLCFLLLLLFTLIGLSTTIIHPDYSQMLASVFGLFLVLSTYAAIGLFISSLTSYQIVAAIITLGIFAFLSKVDNLWQDIDSVRNITYYMNIGGKSLTFIRGLMNLRDFSYFIILIATFLLFTMIRIKSATESISGLKKAIHYCMVIAIAFTVGYISTRPKLNIYVDATRDKLYTITPPTRALLEKLDGEPLEITVFANLLGTGFWAFQPNSQNLIILPLWEPYIRYKRDIKIKFVYYYATDSSSYHFRVNPGKTLREIAEKEANSYELSIDRFLAPAEINKMIDPKAEEFRCFFQLKYKGKTAILRIYNDPKLFPGEDEIAASINRMIATPPRIGFISDEIERGPFSERARDYQLITSNLGNRTSLINQGYDFDTLSLKQRGIPKDLAALVIADPRTPIASDNLEKINSYIDSGGDLFITSEPDRKEVTKPLFDKLGLTLREGMLIQPGDQYSSDILFPYLTDTARNLSPQFARQFQDDIRYYKDTLFRIAMAGAGAIDYREKDGFRVAPLLRTDGSLSWNRLAPINNDSLQLSVGRRPDDQQGTFITALRLNRTIHGKDQRIIVASDADYLTRPQLMGDKPKRYNYNFGFWCLSYFSNGQFPANTLRPKSLDNGFRIRLKDLPVQKLIFYWILPALLAIFCSILLIRRKRK